MSDLMQQAKSFWKRPEGTTGKILLGALAVGGAALTYTYLPIILAWLVMVLSSALTAAALGIALLAVTSPIWSGTMRALTGALLASLVRGITMFFTEIDPIGIMRNYAEKRKKDQTELQKQIGVVEGVKNNLRETMERNEKEATQEIKTAGQAKKLGKRAALLVSSQRAGLLKESNVTYQKLLAMTEKQLAALYKWDEISTVHIATLENTIEQQAQRRKLIRASYKAMNAASRIIRNNEDQAIFAMAAESVTNDFDEKFGKIEQFRKQSQGIFEKFDIQNGVFEEDALKQLEEMDKQADALLIDPNVHTRVAVPEDGGPGPAPTSPDDDVSDLFSAKAKPEENR